MEACGSENWVEENVYISEDNLHSFKHEFIHIQIFWTFTSNLSQYICVEEQYFLTRDTVQTLSGF